MSRFRVHTEPDTAVTDVAKIDHVPQRNDALVVLHARDESLKRKRFELKGERVQVGRQPGIDIELDDIGISRQHVVLSRTSSGGWLVTDENSKNGTLLNDRRLLAPTELRNNDRLKVGSVILKFLSGADLEAAYIEEVSNSMVTDHLTGLANKEEFTRRLLAEVRRATRYGRELSVIAFDLDHFKQLNDRYSHLAGDAVLSAVGRIVTASIRSEDLAARTGGEEFCIIAPETPLEGAVALAEKLRFAVGSHLEEFHGEDLRVTISAGCASLRPQEGWESLLRRADDHSYAAKQGGRNRVSY